MIGRPRIEDRQEQSYMGIRTQVPMGKLKKVIPQVLGEVFAWLKAQGASPAGPPFIRYHVIDMAAEMDVEMGVPVIDTLPGDGRVSPGVLPSGRYASLIYRGSGIKANKALIDWAAEQGLQWDRWEDKNGDAFGSRVEFFLTDPDQGPNRSKWKTEVVIRLADHQQAIT